MEVLLLDRGQERTDEVLDAARRASLVEDHRLRRVFEVSDDGERAYVVAEAARGVTLADLTSHGPLPSEQVRAIIGEAAGALDSAHRHGVRHLALDARSLRVTDDGEVLVVGTGVANVLGAGLELTPARASRRDAADLVALLYLGLTGYDPRMEVAEDGSLVPRELPAPSSVVRGVPADLDDLCLRALTEGEVPAGPGDLLRVLAPWGDIDPPSAARTSSASTAPPPPPIVEDTAEHAAVVEPEGPDETTEPRQPAAAGLGQPPAVGPAAPPAMPAPALPSAAVDPDGPATGDRVVEDAEDSEDGAPVAAATDLSPGPDPATHLSAGPDPVADLSTDLDPTTGPTTSPDPAADLSPDPGEGTEVMDAVQAPAGPAPRRPTSSLGARLRRAQTPPVIPPPDGAADAVATGTAAATAAASGALGAGAGAVGALAAGAFAVESFGADAVSAGRSRGAGSPAGRDRDDSDPADPAPRYAGTQSPDAVRAGNHPTVGPAAAPGTAAPAVPPGPAGRATGPAGADEPDDVGGRRASRGPWDPADRPSDPEEPDGRSVPDPGAVAAAAVDDEPDGLIPHRVLATADALGRRIVGGRRPPVRHARVAPPHLPLEDPDADAYPAPVRGGTAPGGPGADDTVPTAVRTDGGPPPAPRPSRTPVAARTAAAAVIPAAAPRPSTPPEPGPLMAERTPGREVGRGTFDPMPWIVGLFVVLIALVGWWAARTLVTPTSAVDLPSETPPAAPTEGPAPAPGAGPDLSGLPTPVLSHTELVDPEGGNTDNADTAALAADGDPDTYWRTLAYRDPAYGMKTGSGLIVWMEEISAVSGITIETFAGGEGGHVEIRISDPATPGEGRLLAEGALEAGATEFTFDQAVPTAHLIVWITELPTAGTDGANRAEIAEIQVR